MNEWISVKDRLPSNKDNEIVCLINGKCILAVVHDATFSLTQGHVSFYWPTKTWVKDHYYNEVTHWMPLPEPPVEY